jgi:hypothetical protein
MAIVYAHRRNDTKDIFYIGIGRDIMRINKKNNRNKYWHNVVKKVGYSKEIIHKNISWDDACEFEKFYIILYGRKDKKNGSLVNLTYGGEGKPTKYLKHIDYTNIDILINEINNHRTRT